MNANTWNLGVFDAAVALDQRCSRDEELSVVGAVIPDWERPVHVGFMHVAIPVEVRMEGGEDSISA
jgi:hypothetical protein